MEYTLKDYQVDAVRDVLKNLAQARDMYHRYRSLTQFSLTATTGAGKTVMAAAVIEAVFFGNDEFDFEPDPGAVVLWFSDDPSLNEQSRTRIQAASSELESRLRVVESTFSEPSLRPGYVYFLNTQKLSKNSRLVKGDPGPANGQTTLFEPRPDEVQSSIYDTITNTIKNEDLTLYFVLDEAHRGMGTTNGDHTTIVQRLINGQGSVPPMPVVFGISATVERFEKAMKDAKSRAALPSVLVDSALVQASGLLKDDIAPSIPTEGGVFDTVLLTEAVKKVRASSAAWQQYAQKQGETEVVVPLLVVQVGDKPSQETLVRTLNTIYEAWPDLAHDAVANVFGEHQDLTVGQQIVPYIEPQRVQDAKHVRVLLAKNAISTGWDCPRAEVLVSFRPANDRTHITQLLGRMMRTPLARRIPGNELLNSVDCLLPLFNRKTAVGVAEMLMKGSTAKDEADDGEDAGGGQGRRVLFDPIPLYRNPAIEQAVWDKFEDIPSVTIPKKNVKPIRRLTALATALSKDGLVTDAVEQAHQHLHGVLDGRAVQFARKVADARDDVLTMEGEEVRGRVGGGLSYKAFALSADPRAIEDYYRAATRVLSPALCSSYVDHLVGPGGDDDDLLEAHITVASLGRVPEIGQVLDTEADNLTRMWLGQTRVARKGLTDEQQAEYDRLEGMSTQPERIVLTTPMAALADTKVRHADGTETDLPTRTLHVMAAEDGTYPIDLNDWERKVVDAEAKQPGFKGWYRNPSRTAKESLAVAYRDTSGDWKPLRPDFIFFGTAHDGSVAVDLVDPHGHHLSDALPKLKGLADFAEQFEADFRRIESVAETSLKLRVLDITRENVRKAIRSAESGKALYESDLAADY
jgi:type III restriction enzyme